MAASSRHRARVMFGVVLLLALPGKAQEIVPRQMAAVSGSSEGSSNIDGLPQTPDAGSYAWNAAFDVTSVHTSTNGWATLATPSIGYRFNNVFSVDAVIPIYFFRLAESHSAKPRPNAQLVIQRGEVGDMILSGHALFEPRLAEYELTGAVTAPSGDEAYGLTTGRVTFDISNQFARDFGRFTPMIEIGGGDSSTLVNRLVTKTYTSLGPLAHFQAGVATQLTSRINFEADAYEQLPIGDQKIYTSSTRHKKTTTVVTGHNVSEDNGFVTAFDATLEGHSVLTSYYSRSLRLHADTVGVGLTYYLRNAPVEPDAAIGGIHR